MGGCPGKEVCRGVNFSCKKEEKMIFPISLSPGLMLLYAIINAVGRRYGQKESLKKGAAKGRLVT